MSFDLFFFKQKTAYEMRISDWSSDVCSSDLTTENASEPNAYNCATVWPFHSRRKMTPKSARASKPATAKGKRPAQAETPKTRKDDDINQMSIERKIVVMDKRVDVRVDLGSRRIIKKKITQINRTKGKR